MRDYLTKYMRDYLTEYMRLITAYSQFCDYLTEYMLFEYIALTLCIQISNLKQTNKIMDNTLIVDNVTYQTDMIEPPCVHGGKLVKLKREFIFADLDLHVCEQRLLFSAMSLFNTESFLTDPRIISKTMASGKQDFCSLTQTDFDAHYYSLESRTILLSAYETSKLIGTRKYESLDVGIAGLMRKTITLNKKSVEAKAITESFVMLERTARHSFDDERADVILLTFSQSFMPYIVAFRNYDKLEIETLCKLKNKHSFRYLQWFTAKLANNSQATLYMTVEQIKKRFGIEPDQFKQHFVKRVVEIPISEVSQVSDMQIAFVAERNEKKRGKPIERFKFTIKRKSIDVEAIKSIELEEVQSEQIPLEYYKNDVILDDEIQY